jgi:hypothetical protein
VNRIFTNTGVDNLEIVGDEVYIAAHPMLLKFIDHAASGARTPSQVLNFYINHQFQF